MDFLVQLRLRLAMEDDTRDLINQLATRPGMLMEDTSAQAITLGLEANDRVKTKLQGIAESVARIAAFIEAARALQQ